MIDLHCHFLPGIDDGARDIDDALRLARSAVSDGIRHCVLTPHMHEGRFDNQRRNLQPAFEAFQSELVRRNIPLRVGLAAEVRIGYELFGWLENDAVPFLGEYRDRNVILLELPHGQIPPGAAKLTRQLLDDGLQVMIAHPERNKYVLRDLQSIRPFIDMGCLLQVTGGSVVGRFGRPAQRRAQEMLELGWVHVLATDAHNIEWRPPMLREARAAAALIVGEEESWRLVEGRPWDMARSHFES